MWVCELNNNMRRKCVMIRCHKQFLAKLLNWLKLVMGLEISNVRASVVMLKIIVTLASGFKRDNKMFLMLALAI